MNKNTIISVVITLVIVAAGAYWYFSVGTGNDAPLTATGTKNKAQTEFQSLIVKLTSISFNTNIFSDARFVSLVDITTPISPEVVGRPDPFAAISGISE